MTASMDVDTLSGVALAEALAVEVMGWSVSRRGNDYVYFNTPQGDRIVHSYDIKPTHGMEWQPYTDHNHAAEVMRTMREKYNNLEFEWVISCPDLDMDKLFWSVSAFWMNGEDGEWAGRDGLLPDAISRVALLANRMLISARKTDGDQ